MVTSSLIQLAIVAASLGLRPLWLCGSTGGATVCASGTAGAVGAVGAGVADAGVAGTGLKTGVSVAAAGVRSFMVRSFRVR